MPSSKGKTPEEREAWRQYIAAYRARRKGAEELNEPLERLNKAKDVEDEVVPEEAVTLSDVKQFDIMARLYSFLRNSVSLRAFHPHRYGKPAVIPADFVCDIEMAAKKVNGGSKLLTDELLRLMLDENLELIPVSVKMSPFWKPVLQDGDYKQLFYNKELKSLCARSEVNIQDISAADLFGTVTTDEIDFFAEV